MDHDLFPPDSSFECFALRGVSTDFPADTLQLANGVTGALCQDILHIVYEFSSRRRRSGLSGASRMRRRG